jgi:hypothetical protein
MGFVVVNMNTRCAVRHPRTGRDSYRTEASARAAKTRLIRLDMDAYLNHTKYPRTDYEVMTVESYRAQVPMREVVNLMTGTVCLERADTPWHCSVASESYWSA